MGAAIGAILVERGHEVLWRPEGRSGASAQRAEQAGLRADEQLTGAEAILSICPPHAALAVAESLRGSDALVLDGNAISPSTASRIGALIGERFVDGAIVGPPPVREGTTRLYLSGPRAGEIAALFEGTRLEPVQLEGSPVAASALKMAYAAWTKGSAALLLAAASAARALKVEDALLAEWRRSQPHLEERLGEAAKAARTKGWRWTGEMTEIASTFETAGLPAGFHEAAAEVYQRSAVEPER